MGHRLLVHYIELIDTADNLMRRQQRPSSNAKGSFGGSYLMPVILLKHAIVIIVK